MAGQAQGSFVDPLLAARVGIAALGSGVVLDIWCVVFLSSKAGEFALAPDAPWGRLHVIARLATLLALAAWLDRLYANAASLGVRTQHARTWAALSFIVPPFAFFRPFQMVDEVWRAIKGASRFRVVIFGWWATFVIPIAVLLTSFGLDPEVRHSRALILTVFNIIAGVLAVLVVHVVTMQQKRAFQSQGGDAAEFSYGAEIQPARPESMRKLPRAAATTPVVSIAPGRAPAMPGVIRNVAPPLPRPMRATLVEKRKVARRSISIPPEVWKNVVIGMMIMMSLGMIASAAVLVFRTDASTRASGIAYAIAGMLLMLGSHLLRREGSQGAEGNRWSGFAYASTALAVMNVIVLAEIIW